MTSPIATDGASDSQRPSHSQHLTDAEFLSAFESCTLPADAFRHAEHIRLAWIYLDDSPLDVATEKMASAIRRFAHYHTGTTAKYNEALTHAWMRLVALARARCPAMPDFAAFANANPMLFDRKRAFEHYGIESP